MKTLKIIPNVLLLLRELLFENELPAEKLQATLEKFVATLHMYQNSNLIKNDTEQRLINEATEGTEGFILVLELSNLIFKRGKIDSKYNAGAGS